MSDFASGQVRAARKVSDIQGQLHVDGYLTNFQLMFRQAPSVFISGLASTGISVRHASDRYPVYPRGYFWRDEAQVRPLGGRPVQVGYKIGHDNYNAEEWALETTVDDRERANVDDIINLEENAITLLESKQMIREDRIWATNFFQTGVWTNEEVGGNDFEPFNDSASTPLTTIDRLKTEMAQQTGMMPNTMIVGANVKDALRNNPDIVDRIKYTQTGVASDGILASLFEVDTFRVARAVYNTALETNEDDGGLDMEFICDPNAIWLGYIAATGGMKTPTAIARFAWTGLIPGAMNNSGGVITRGRDDRAYSDWFHSRNAFDLKVVSQDLGMFITNANIPTSN